MRILVTGGSGFIGSNFLSLFVPRFPDHFLVNVDKLTYAANRSSLKDIESLPNYTFEWCDITDCQAVIALCG